MVKTLALLALTVALATSGGCASAADRVEASSSAGPIVAETVVDGLRYPWALAFLPDGAMLVTERPGRLRLIENGELVKDPVAGVPAVVAKGQGGLLDVAIGPDFARNGEIFFTFAEAGKSGSGTAVARAELVRKAGVPARLENVKVIFRQDPKIVSNKHYGSRVVVARDGTLYVTLGERGKRDLAQDLGKHMGKVARINRDGSVPADNPFLDRAGIRPEIWSYGHRNPQGAALDPSTGLVWTVEHGAKGGDEVNQPEAGINYGWPVITYGKDYSGDPIGIGTGAEGMAQPKYYWDPSIAPSGMAFGTGGAFPAWTGDIFVGALAGRALVRLDRDDSGAIVGEERLFEKALGRIRDVRTGPDGALWLLTDAADGALIRVAPAVSG